MRYCSSSSVSTKAQDHLQVEKKKRDRKKSTPLYYYIFLSLRYFNNIKAMSSSLHGARSHVWRGRREGRLLLATSFFLLLLLLLLFPCQVLNDRVDRYMKERERRREIQRRCHCCTSAESVQVQPKNAGNKKKNKSERKRRKRRSRKTVVTRPTCPSSLVARTRRLHFPKKKKRKLPVEEVERYMRQGDNNNEKKKGPLLEKELYNNN